ERFSANPRVVETTLNLDRNAYTVVGVLPPRFRFPDMANAPQVLIALRTPGSSAFNIDETTLMFQVVARLRPGDSLARVQTELQWFQQTRLSADPAPLARMAAGRKMEVTPLQRHLAGDSRKPLIVLLA